MIGAVSVGAGLYLIIAVLVFGSLYASPANAEFRPLHSAGAALGWLPALVYVQAQARLGGETE